MRWANKQSVPASALDIEGGRIPVQRSRYLQETLHKRQETPTQGERHHYSHV